MRVVRLFALVLPSLEVDVLLVPRRGSIAVLLPLLRLRCYRSSRRLFLVPRFIDRDELLLCSTDLLLQLTVLQEQKTVSLPSLIKKGEKKRTLMYARRHSSIA